MSHLDDDLARIDTRLGQGRATLPDLAHRIRGHPEIRFEEVRETASLAEALEARGLAVERGVVGLPTSVRAGLDGTGPGPTVAVLCEYDALPRLGHACGHDVIATMGARPGFALAPLSVKRRPCHRPPPRPIAPPLAPPTLRRRTAGCCVDGLRRPALSAARR